MILTIGEILVDIFPDYRHTGGAPFNFAVHLKNLGVPVRFITRVGKDDDGQEILRLMKSLGFQLDNVQIDPGHPTGKVLITLNKQGVPRFEILKNMAYDYISPDSAMVNLLEKDIDIIYVGTLVQRSEAGYGNMQKILAKKRKSTKILYDVNLRPECYNRKIIISTLNRCDLLKLNDEELMVIKTMLGVDLNETAFLTYLRENFEIDMIALTRGSRGSRLVCDKGDFSTVPEPVAEIKDTVGAGDAFAAILSAGYVHGWNPEKILTQATRLARSVCMIEGAFPQDKKFYKKFMLF